MIINNVPPNLKKESFWPVGLLRQQTGQALYSYGGRQGKEWEEFSEAMENDVLTTSI